MNRIKAPYTPEQVEKLNDFQKNGNFVEFTCCSPFDEPECLRAVKVVDGVVVEGESEGLLTATTEGWICPCGKYTQDWTYDFMFEGK